MNKEKMRRILEAGVEPNYWSALLLVYQCEGNLPKDDKLAGWIHILMGRDYIEADGNTLTEKGLKVLEITGDLEPVTYESIMEEKEPEEEKFDFKTWVADLHKKLQDKMIELTGKRQKVLQGKYSFLCNSRDLEIKLSRVIDRYQVKQEDLSKIEEILLRYIENSNKAKWDKTPLVEYYIMKDGVSRLYTDLDNYEETQEEEKQVQAVTQRFI